MYICKCHRCDYCWEALELSSEVAYHETCHIRIMTGQEDIRIIRGR